MSNAALIGAINNVVARKYTMTQATLKKNKIPSASLELLDLSRPRERPIAEHQDMAGKCAGKVSYILDKIFKKVESQQAEKADMLKSISIAVWHKLMIEFTGWSNSPFLFDELITKTVTLLLEDENTFIFGEDELNKFIFSALPASQALDMCAFSAEHNDYHTIDCLRIKFEEQSLDKIQSKLNNYSEEIVKIARIFAMRQEEICMAEQGVSSQKIPHFLRCFSFFSYGMLHVIKASLRASTGCI